MTHYIKVARFDWMSARRALPTPRFPALGAALTCALSLIAPARASLPPTVPAPSRHFETDRTFEHPLFETEAQCERARLQAPAANCAQWIAFTADGRATVVLAERLERASYELSLIHI